MILSTTVRISVQNQLCKVEKDFDNVIANIGTTPTCDKSAVFRTISGECNNLNEGQELWGSMTIQMRREEKLHGIDDLFKVGTYNDLLNTTSDRQGNSYHISILSQ